MRRGSTQEREGPSWVSVCVCVCVCERAEGWVQVCGGGEEEGGGGEVEVDENRG